MEYGILGRTGITVSRMGLGGAPLGDAYGKMTDGEAERIVHSALDLGINVIDTAPLYGQGESERRIGLALREGKRKRAVIATKIGLPGQAYDADSALASAAGSMSRLRTDYLDVLQLHDVETMDFDKVMSETVNALLRLKEQGTIRALGVTTRSLPLLLAYMRTGMFDTIQFYNRYMLIDYTAKDEVLPLAAEMNLGVLNGSVLAMGILADNPVYWLEKDVVERGRERIQAIEFLRRGQLQGGLIEPAMRFSLANPDIHITLTGAAAVDQIIQNTGYCDGRGLPKEDERRLLELFGGQKLFS